MPGSNSASDATISSTGYGPSGHASTAHGGGRFNRLLFDGDERRYEQWEVKFLGYMKIQQLKDVITAPADPDPTDADATGKNELAYAELIQFLDDKSLSLVMRDAKDNGRKALEILRGHYAGSGKPRVISLYTELTSLVKMSCESITDYVIRAENTHYALKNAGETVEDSLLIAMILKGLPEPYKPFVVVVTQSEKKQTFTEFKVALRSFEDTEKCRSTRGGEDSVMRMSHGALRGAFQSAKSNVTCYSCGQVGHISRKCTANPKNGTGNNKWCPSCKSATHNGNTCRRRKNADKVKHVTDTPEDQPKGEHSFSFAFRAVDSDHVGSCGLKSDALLVDCGATTHIVTDESKFVKFDDTFVPEKHYIELADGAKSNNVAQKRGDAAVTLMDRNGKEARVLLKNALYIPSYPQDIFSVDAATAGGAEVLFHHDKAELIHRSGTVFDIEKRGRLYYLSTYDHPGSDITDSVCVTRDIEGWHEVMGHCNFEDLKKLPDLVDGMKIIGKVGQPDDCSVCILGKMNKTRSRVPRVRSSAPLKLVHTDLAGPIDPVSTEGFKYAMVFTDDYSGLVFVYFLKSKSDAVNATERFLADSAPFGNVKCMRSDNGTEFTCEAFRSLLRKHRIRHDTSAPYSPHQNGTAERCWRVLFEMGRCLLIQAKLPQELWPYAVMAAAYIRNRCFKKRIQQTPYFVMTGRKPNLAHMRVFGSVCYAYKQMKKKLDPRCEKGIFVGYDRLSPAYLVYFPETGKVMKHRVVKFVSTTPVSASTSAVNEPTDEVFYEEDDMFFGQGSGISVEKPTDIIEPSVASVEDEVEIEVESDMPTDASLDESVPANGIEHGPLGKNDLRQSDSESESRTPEFVVQKPPVRERKLPSHLTRDYIVGDMTGIDFEDDDQVMLVDYCYKVNSELPQCYKQAMRSADSSSWEDAMNDEMNSLKENNTFTLTPLPKGRKAVGGRWVYAIKEDANGAKTYKARYVAKGYSQVEGIDYQETYAPTASFTSVRTLMQLAAQHGLILHQMDVKTAYLNAPIDCEVYVDQAEGFEVPANQAESRLVYKLNKSLYGLKQSGRNWNSMLHGYLIDNDFIQSLVDPCVYVRKTEHDLVIIIVWVDDLIIAASSDAVMGSVKKALKQKFVLKDLGKLAYFLGIHFEQGNGYVKMNQKRYLNKLLEKFGMLDCKPRCTPSEQKITCNENDELVDSRRYREIIGSLIYLMTCTRPDICWTVTKLSQYLSQPRQGHLTAAKHVMRYLKGTNDYELCYKKSEDGLSLIGYSDADWASSPDDRRSTTGYCFALTREGAPISWKSRKQPTVALSTCEAEYIALSATVQESKFLTQLLNDIDGGHQYEPVLIFEDNQGTIALAQNPVNRQRSKHIDIRYHFIRSALSSGTIKLQYCPTANMIADVMTKPATRFKLESFKNFLFG